MSTVESAFFLTLQGLGIIIFDESDVRERPILYEKRTYRELVKSDDLVTFEVIVKETDLLISAGRDLFSEARESVLKHRLHLETYISKNPEFETSLVPVQEDPLAPPIIGQMIRASRIAGVGPMAAGAGALAEEISKDLLPSSQEMFVENGGDIYLSTKKERTIAVYAGASPYSLKLGILIQPEMTPLGVCTSSGTVGPSLSFGKTDAVCILSPSAALADAAATSVGNKVKGKEDIGAGLDRAKEIEGVTGAVIILGDKMGAWGDVHLTRI